MSMMARAMFVLEFMYCSDKIFASISATLVV